MLVAPPHPEDREESRERQNPRRRRGYDLSWTSLDRHVVHAHLESQHIVRFRKSKRQRRVDMAVEQRGDVDGDMGVTGDRRVTWIGLEEIQQYITWRETERVGAARDDVDASLLVESGSREIQGVGGEEGACPISNKEIEAERRQLNERIYG